MSVDAYFAALPEAPRAQLTAMRAVLHGASQAENIPLSESLKWGQPSFAPPRKLGTPVRLSWSEKFPDHCAFLVHCQTTLVESWRHMYGAHFTYDGTRAVHLPLASSLPEDALHQMAVMAFTYHAAKT
ncbi:DUF1801 domain-containing protein [Shimia sp. MMG029]|uniref:DUF1801 domain-containing protein n=1 Tax=Shimia sp. MMG029 TaxID=3021978 RepID=UPI0022FEE549|nr:DUF1801 domain-containing protein [Shimia sp. MMG029]MDA5556282.1 DUF1801 domain-containing protein [Shimia sp. MMG029]